MYLHKRISEPWNVIWCFKLRQIVKIILTSNAMYCNAIHCAVRSLVISRIDYCNGLLSSIPSTQLDRVQRLQNWAARLVFQVSRDHPSQPLLNSLHWLPLKQRIIFKLLLFVYKILNNEAPKYLDTCLNLHVYTPIPGVWGHPVILSASHILLLAPWPVIGHLLYLLQTTGMIYHLYLDSLHQSVISARPWKHIF